MLHKVEEYIKKYRMIEEGDKIITGVSGGADSICLLFMLWQLARKMHFSIHVVHVEHGLRGEDALEDCRYVEAFCKKLGIDCMSFHVNVEETAEKEKMSIEEAGRKLRYEVFESECARTGGNKIAVAHNKKDCAETFLWNVVRGAGTKGMASIPPVMGKIIRPLLCLEREEIEEYLRKNGISYRTDKTNLENHYTRNKIRNVLFPYMEKELNSQAVNHLAEAACHMQQVHAYLETQVQKLFKKCGKLDGERLEITLQTCVGEPEFLVKELLAYSYRSYTGQNKNITARHLEQMYALCYGQSGRRISLPGGTEAVKSGERLILKKQKEEPEIFDVELNLPGETHLPFQVGSIHAQITKLEKSKNFDRKPYTKCFDYDTIECNLHVRTRQSGDYILIQGGTKRQSLKSYFINQKIPLEKRDKIPLLAAGKQILWVIGYRTGETCGVTDNTKNIIEVQYKGNDTMAAQADDTAE